MSEKQRLQLENELLMTCSKAQAINKYIDELEESSKLSELWCDSRAKIRELENQQKEFIEYMKNEINKWHYNYDSYNYEYEIEEPTAEELLQTVLSKYKEIIGGKDENNKQ